MLQPSCLNVDNAVRSVFRHGWTTVLPFLLTAKYVLKWVPRGEQCR